MERVHKHYYYIIRGKEYEILNLTEYKVYSYGHKFDDDQLSEIISKMKKANTIVIGSPLYWHNICGSVRNVLDRFYGLVQQNELSGQKMYFLFQGAAPEKWMMEAGEYTMKRFAGLYGMTYMGMATNQENLPMMKSMIFSWNVCRKKEGEKQNESITGKRKSA